MIPIAHLRSGITYDCWHQLQRECFRRHVPNRRGLTLAADASPPCELGGFSSVTLPLRVRVASPRTSTRQQYANDAHAYSTMLTHAPRARPRQARVYGAIRLRYSVTWHDFPSAVKKALSAPLPFTYPVANRQAVLLANFLRCRLIQALAAPPLPSQRPPGRHPALPTRF